MKILLTLVLANFSARTYLLQIENRCKTDLTILKFPFKTLIRIDHFFRYNPIPKYSTTNSLKILFKFSTVS